MPTPFTTPHTTPRKSNLTSSSTTPQTPSKPKSPTKHPLNGLFSDNTWWCNCSPRLPAPYFIVKKAGPNKGKGFYTCQESRDSSDSCGFFLWEEKAKEREARCLMGGGEKPSSEEKLLGGEKDGVIDKNTVEGHIEASERMQKQLAAQGRTGYERTAISRRNRDGYASSPSANRIGSGREGVKVKIEHDEDDVETASEDEAKEDDDFGDWPLTMEDEAELVDNAMLLEEQRKEVRRPSPLLEGLPLPPVTPRKDKEKGVRFEEQMLTPGTKRKRSISGEAEGLPTPHTGSRLRRSDPDEHTNDEDDVFTTPASASASTATLSHASARSQPREGLISPSASPTPHSRHSHISSPFFASAADLNATSDPSADYEITTAILSLLSTSPTPVPPETTTQIRNTLNRYALQQAGVSKGREITRLALKTKDASIADLKQRIETLEKQREMDKLVIQQLKGDIKESVEKRSKAAKASYAKRKDGGAGGFWRS